MEKGEKAAEYLEKANKLEKQMKRFFDYKNILPSYGDLLTIQNKIVSCEPYGMDKTDYIWSLTLPQFYPNLPERYNAGREQIRKDMSRAPKGQFLCSYYGLLASMDNEIFNEDTIMKTMDYCVPQCMRPGKYLPMSNTITEIIDVEDGNPFHDVRPIVFSIAPWLASVTQLGVRKMPFGIAVRATKYLEEISNFEFRKSFINFTFKGTGRIKEIQINGIPLKHSLQIPENSLKTGKNDINIQMENIPDENSVLIASTMRLLDINDNNNSIRYSFECYGKNILTFRNLDKKAIIKDASGKEIEAREQKTGNFSYLEFSGRGKMDCILK
jgi:hypothetical protein